MGIVVITGIPGVGKTTVIGRAAKVKRMNVVNYGTVMFETAESKGLAKDRDEMRKIQTDKQIELQREAAEKINSMGDVIVDTHATIKTPRGYLAGLPIWVLKALRPEVVVLVEADVDEIMARRAKDTNRVRDEDAEASINEHQQMNRAVAMAYAMMIGATVKIVQNHDDGLDDAVNDLVRAL